MINMVIVAMGKCSVAYRVDKTKAVVALVKLKNVTALVTMVTVIIVTW